MLLLSASAAVVKVRLLTGSARGRHPGPGSNCRGVAGVDSGEFGTITVFRVKNPWRDRVRLYKLVIDGAESGSVRRGEQTAARVPAGRHEVRMCISWCSSPAVRVDVAAGGDVVLECGPGRGNVRRLVIEDPANYLFLRRRANTSNT